MKRFAQIVTVLTFLLAFAGVSRAAEAWYTCTVSFAGYHSTSQAVACLTDTAATPAFTAMWFNINPVQTNGFLATLFTAGSIGKTVLIYTDPTAASPSIDGCYTSF